MTEAASNGSTLQMDLLPSGLLDALSALQRSRYGAAAATTLYVYDILITFELELEYIWGKLSFSLPIIFYFLNRYVSLTFFILYLNGLSDIHGPLSDAWCRAPFFPLGLAIGHAVWTGVMSMRVCALWKQRTKLVILVWILWALTGIVVFLCGFLSYGYQQATTSYDNVFQICIPQRQPTGLALAGQYIPILPAVFETFLAALTIIKAFDFAFKPSFGSLPLLYRVVARDGGLYFVVVVFITVATLISWYTRPALEVFLFALLYWSLLSTVVSRLALNLRETYYAEPDHVTGIVSAGTTNVTGGARVISDSSAGFGNRQEIANKDVRHRDPSFAMRYLGPTQNRVTYS